ncbi:reactive chlorine resistance membrane protein RclC [Bradyrhizobium sp. Ash2021]|uniref:reactive chlorine resistance membrane protein RclC n=1 Tax=Bradyrhizobium sp. Ash2021 TaxID=2954771 RepID=UPI0028155A09|nr:reactive chlorine resistance membrane protein RclC [Bradyrhizobium sp. Ash2021]WMT73526.1 reactive chlorine resistance membrane protein RclC [Bradyrhizobium sp. Ash2021]
MYFHSLLQLLSSPLSNRLGMWTTRLAIAVVFIWIGALKFVPYEADSITPFVANSPVMSFFYNHPKEYKAHLTREGELKAPDREWQTANNTYGFSEGLGTLELTIGFLTLAGFISTRGGLIGASLAFCTPIVTLSFLVTTPEAWVPALGDGAHGFPFLSGAGRLVLKDTVILGGSWLLMVDAARLLLDRGLGPRTTGLDSVKPTLVPSRAMGNRRSITRT